MSDCFVLYLLLTCMKKKTSGADKFTNNSYKPIGIGNQVKKWVFKQYNCKNCGKKIDSRFILY